MKHKLLFVLVGLLNYNWLAAQVPVVTGYSPAPETTNVPVTQNLTLSFNTGMQKGSGKLVLVRGNAVPDSIDVASNAVTVAGNQVVIDPPGDLPAGQVISVRIPAGALLSTGNVAYAGINNNTTWRFTTDGTRPLVVGLTPAQNASNVAPNSRLTLVFSEKIRLGSGKIIIRNGASILDSITIGPSIAPVVTIAADSIVTINPSGNFPNGANITVRLDGNTFVDFSGNPYAGQTWNFRIAPPPDITPPSIVAASYNPAVGASNVPVAADLSFRFSEKVRKRSGNIILRVGNAIFETLSVGSSAITIASDSIITINPLLDFPSSASVSVVIEPGTFEDLAGNTFAGGSNWQFTVADIIPPEVIANSYNPANGATNVAPNTSLVLRFNEKITKGSGSIIIQSGNNTFTSIDVNTTAVTISNDSIVTINAGSNFPSEGNMSVIIGAGTFVDIAGNASVANTALPWRFRVRDYLKPTVVRYEPADNATEVLPNAKLRLFFSEKVKKGSQGTITLTREFVTQGISIASAAIEVTDSIVTITPPTPLPLNTRISIQITAGAFTDLANNTYDGIAASDITTWDFGTLTDNIPPTVTRLQPRDDSTNVPANARLVIVFSEKVNPVPNGWVLIRTPAGTQSIPVTSNNVIISGANNNVVTITPLQNFASGADVYVLVVPNSFADEAGHMFAGITDASGWNFKVADTVPPGVLDRTPANGATGVFPGANLVITFTEPVRQGTGNITISQGNGNPTQTINITDNRYVSVNGNTVSITRPAPLVSGATVSVQIPGAAITDLSGLPFAGFAANAWTFTVADTQPPVITTNGLDPADNSVNVARNKLLRITFNERIQKGGGDIIIYENGVPNSIPVTNSNITIANNVVTINYPAIKAGGLAAGANVYVLIPYDAFRDLAGNPFQGIGSPAAWNFSVIDNVKPIISQLSPANGATNVAASTNLVITFSEPIRAGTGNNNRINIFRVGTATPLETIRANNTSKVSITNQIVTIRPNALPATGVEIYITIEPGAFADNAGNTFDGFTATNRWRFRVADTQKPTIATLNPVNNRQNVGLTAPLVITFSEPVQRGTTGVVQIFSIKNANQFIDVAQLQVNNRTVTIPHSPFQSSDTLYVLIFPNTIRDQAGNGFDGIISDQVWRFTTADVQAPQLVSLRPVRGATGVPLNTNLEITFDEEIRTSTGSVSIYRRSDQTLLQGIPAADIQVSGKTATIRLTDNLPAATDLYVLVSENAFTDVARNRFAGISDITRWTFTTIDLSAPVITTYLPGRNATSVPTNTNLSFTFNKPIQKGSGGNIRLQLSGQSNDVVIPVTSNAVSVQVDRRTVDVNLSGFFPNGIASGAEVSVTIDGGTFVDLANNNAFAGINASNPWRFRVNDIIPPDLVSFTPLDNAPNVPVNTQLVLTFSEPVQAGSGKIYIYRNNVTEPVITLNASQGSGFTGATITYTLPDPLPSETAFYVLIDNNAFTDMSNLPFAGISSPTRWKFTTADVTPPTVIALSPTDRATSATQELVITMSESVRVTATLDSVTISQSTGTLEKIALTNPKVRITGAVVSIAHDKPFDSEATVTVQIPVSGLEDLSGNRLANAITWSFSAVDIVKPTVTRLSPGSGQSSVATTSPLVITFSEQVIKSTRTGKIFLTESSNQGSRTQTIDVSSAEVKIDNIVENGQPRSQVTIEHQPFLSGATVSVTMFNDVFTDLAGNTFDGFQTPESWRFRVSDVLLPYIVTKFPDDEATGVFPNTELIINFSEPMKRGSGSITLSYGNTARLIRVSDTVSIRLREGGSTVVIRPPEPFISNARVTVTITNGAFTDLEGNPFGLVDPDAWNFTIADFTNPIVMSYDPVRGSQNVAQDKVLSLTFDKAVRPNAAAAADAIKIFRADNASSPILSIDVQDATLVNIDPANPNVVRIIPGSALPSGTLLFVTVAGDAFKDLSGNNFLGIGVNDWSFTVSDVIPPGVASLLPLNNAQNVPVNTPLEITFTEPVVPVADKKLYIVVNGIIRDSVLATNTTVNGNRVSIRVRSFTSEDRVVVQIQRGAFKDAAGNPFAGFENTTDWNFRMADVNPPLAVTFTPPDNRTFVPINAVLSITFNEPVKKGNNGFIVLNTGNSQTIIPIDDPAVVIESGGRTVRITPPGDLPYRSDISVQIPEGAITDLAGNSYKGVNPDADNKQWRFRTVPPPDNDPPQVTDLSPRKNAVDVAVNAELVMTFNEPVFKGTGGTITISSAAGTQRIDITANPERLRFQNNTVTIKPPANMPPNANVSVQITPGAIIDSVGNRFAGYANNQDWNFLTSDPSDTIAPQVQLLEPPDDGANVQVSQNFKIVFSETMRRGQGSIVITDNGVPRFIPVNDPQVTLTGNVLVINPDRDLAAGANVNIQIPAAAFTDLANNRFTHKGKSGIPDPQDWNFLTASNPDRTPPRLQSQLPEPGATVPANTTRLILVFDEPMKKYEGVIRIRQNNAVTTLDVSRPNVIIDPTNPTRIFIDVPAGFPAGARVSIVIPSSAFVDLANNSFDGFSEANPWRFTIEDRDPPTVRTFYPRQNATGIARNTNLILEFNEPIQINEALKNSKQVVISGSGLSPIQIPFSNAQQIRVVNNRLIINPANELPITNEPLSVLIDPESLTDQSGNVFEGITDNRTWQFRVGGFIDDIPPQLAINAFDPASNLPNVDNEATLRATFNEPIQKGNGNLTIVVDGRPTVLNIANPQISINDNQIVIKLLNPFPFLARVYILLERGAITDRANNPFSGITDPVAWNFIVEKAPPVELIVSEEDLLVDDTIQVFNVIATLSERRPGIAKATLYYRGITEPDSSPWQSDSLISQGLGYSAPFTQAVRQADPIGLEYYFELTFESSLNTNPVRTGTFYLYHNYVRSGLKFPALKAGSNVTDYQIVAVPLELKKNTISDVFVDDLQLYNINKWRIFRFDNETQTSLEYQRGLQEITPGLGYWFISRNREGIDTLDTGEGTTIRRNRTNPFSMILKKGWNQIGNPYNFDIIWDDILKVNPGLDSLTQFNTYEGGYRDGTILPRFRGAFVLVDNETRITIPTTRNKSPNAGRTSREIVATFNEDSQWEINFGLQASETAYQLAGVGMHPAARQGRDQFDRIALPRLPQHLDITFAHPEHFARFFTKDMMPVQDNFMWEFTVNSGLPAQNVDLAWTHKLDGVPDKKWILFDVQQNRAIDLTLLSEYRFWLEKSALFRLYYGTPAYIRENLKPEFGSFGQIYPNPFSQTTTIPFALAKSNQPYQVRLDVFTITGVKVATLANGVFETGLHEVTWDGHGADGSRVATGMYICQLEIINESGKSVHRKKVILQ